MVVAKLVVLATTPATTTSTTSITTDTGSLSFDYAITVISQPVSSVQRNRFADNGQTEMGLRWLLYMA